MQWGGLHVNYEGTKTFRSKCIHCERVTVQEGQLDPFGGEFTFSHEGTCKLYVPGGATTYSTDFANLNENPLSDGDRWLHGKTHGLDWQDVRCANGYAFGAGPSESPPYDDPTAVLKGVWGPVQEAEAIVRIDSSSTQVNQEVELRLLSTIGPHVNSGYEFLFSVTNNSYVEIMRWNSGTTLPTFNSVTGTTTGPRLRTGYRIKGTVASDGRLSLYVDSGNGYGSPLLSQIDTTYRTGSPGIGFFQHGGPAGPLSGYGLSYFSAKAQ